MLQEQFQEQLKVAKIFFMSDENESDSQTDESVFESDDKEIEHF